MKKSILLLLFVSIFNLVYGQRSVQEDYVIELSKGFRIFRVYTLEKSGILVVSSNRGRFPDGKLEPWADFYFQVYDTLFQPVFKFNVNRVSIYGIGVDFQEREKQFHMTINRNNKTSELITIDGEALKGYRNTVDITSIRTVGTQLYLNDHIHYTPNGFYVYRPSEYVDGFSTTEYVYTAYEDTFSIRGTMKFKADGPYSYSRSYGQIKDGTAFMLWERDYQYKMPENECSQYLIQLDTNGNHWVVDCIGDGKDIGISKSSKLITGMNKDDFYLVDGMQRGKDLVEGFRFFYVKNGVIQIKDSIAFKDIPGFKGAMLESSKRELTKLNGKSGDQHDLNYSLSTAVWDSLDGRINWVGLMVSESQKMYNRAGTSASRKKSRGDYRISHFVELQFNEAGLITSKAMSLPGSYNRTWTEMLKIRIQSDYTDLHVQSNGSIHLFEYYDDRATQPTLEETAIADVLFQDINYTFYKALYWYGNKFLAYNTALEKYTPSGIWTEIPPPLTQYLLLKKITLEDN